MASAAEQQSTADNPVSQETVETGNVPIVNCEEAEVNVDVQIPECGEMDDQNITVQAVTQADDQQEVNEQVMTTHILEEETESTLPRPETERSRIRTGNLFVLPIGKKNTQRKRSRVGDRETEKEETRWAKSDRYAIGKTMKDLHELVKKLVKAVTKSSSNAREADDLFTTLTVQVTEITTEMMNCQEEKMALMEQVIALQQSATREGPMMMKKQETAPTYLQTAQKGLAKAVAAGTCLPPPVLPETTKHVPAEQVILYKAERKGVLPTKAEQEDFRSNFKNIVGSEIMNEVSVIRATRFGGYTIIFRSEGGRDAAMRMVTESQEYMTEEEKKKRIIAPKKKVAKVVCREPPVGYTQTQIMSDFYGRHNPKLSLIRHCHRQAKIFETRLGWVFELSTSEAAAIESQGNRIRYGPAKELRVEEFIPLQQCYRCCLFGHSAKECIAIHEHCRLCGKQGHSGKDCLLKDDKMAWRCANCIWNNENRGTNLPVDHAAAQLHKCAIAQNEKAIRRSQLATAGVFTAPQKHFMPKASEEASALGAQSLPKEKGGTQNAASGPSTISQSARRRTPSLHLARCYVPPTSSSTTSSSATTTSRNEVVSLRPVPVGGGKVPPPHQRRGASRAPSGRGRGREAHEWRGGTNSSNSSDITTQGTTNQTTEPQAGDITMGSVNHNV